MATDEPVVLDSTPMPRGYTFVRKGNVYVTAHCRRATHEAGRTVYVVVGTDKGRPKTAKAAKAAKPAKPAPVGLRCPAAIVAAVRAAERDSRTARKAATGKRDAALAAAFRDALLAAYPAVPRAMVPQIVQHALVKRERRVARTTTLGLAARVRLAVRAHIRHRCTNYEALLRGIPDGANGANGAKDAKHAKDSTRDEAREGARAQTLAAVDAVERQWAGRAAAPAKHAKGTGKPAGGQDAATAQQGKDGHKDGRTEAKAKEALHAYSANEKRKRGNATQYAEATTPTRPARPARSSKKEARARIVKSQKRWGETAADAVVVDSDSDWTP